MGEYLNDVTPEEIKVRMEGTKEYEVSAKYLETRESEPIDHLLDQVAEEAAELVQACIKYKRALGMSTPTKCSAEKALENILEEFADTVGCMEALKQRMDKMHEENPYQPALLSMKEFDDKVKWWTHYKRTRFMMRYFNDLL